MIGKQVTFEDCIRALENEIAMLRSCTNTPSHRDRIELSASYPVPAEYAELCANVIFPPPPPFTKSEQPLSASSSAGDLSEIEVLNVKTTGASAPAQASQSPSVVSGTPAQSQLPITSASAQLQEIRVGNGDTVECRHNATNASSSVVRVSNSIDQSQASCATKSLESNVELGKQPISDSLDVVRSVSQRDVNNVATIKRSSPNPVSGISSHNASPTTIPHMSTAMTTSVDGDSDVALSGDTSSAATSVNILSSENVKLHSMNGGGSAKTVPTSNSPRGDSGSDRGADRGVTRDILQFLAPAAAKSSPTSSGGTLNATNTSTEISSSSASMSSPRSSAKGPSTTPSVQSTQKVLQQTKKDKARKGKADEDEEYEEKCNNTKGSGDESVPMARPDRSRRGKASDEVEHAGDEKNPPLGKGEEREGGGVERLRRSGQKRGLSDISGEQTQDINEEIAITDKDKKKVSANASRKVISSTSNSSTIVEQRFTRRRVSNPVEDNNIDYDGDGMVEVDVVASNVDEDYIDGSEGPTRRSSRHSVARVHATAKDKDDNKEAVVENSRHGKQKRAQESRSRAEDDAVAVKEEVVSRLRGRPK